MGIVQRHRTIKTLAFLIGIGLIITGGYLLATSIAKQNPGGIKPPTASAVKQQGQDAPKTADQRKLYQVPADHPRELVISKLGVDAIILPMGTTNNVLNAPVSAWDVGWYNASALPSTKQTTGALLIDGHVNDALNSPGIFYKLDTLLAGDILTIYDGANHQYDYTVLKVTQVPLDKVDMGSMVKSILPGRQGLNLITCGGTYNSQEKTYNDRILVYAVESTQPQATP